MFCLFTKKNIFLKALILLVILTFIPIHVDSDNTLSIGFSVETVSAQNSNTPEEIQRQLQEQRESGEAFNNEVGESTTGLLGSVYERTVGLPNRAAEFVIDGTLAGYFAEFLNFVKFVVVSISTLLLFYTGQIVNFTISIIFDIVAFVLKDPLFNELWSFIRDIVNLIIIASLIGLGVATIVNYAPIQTKPAFIQILFVAVLINFSLFFTKVLIDVSGGVANALNKEIEKSTDNQSSEATASFLDAVVGAPSEALLNKGIALNIINASRITSLYELPVTLNKEISDDSVKAAFYSLGGALIYSAFAAFLAFYLFKLTYLVIKIAVHMILVALTSPIGFIPQKIPIIGDYSKRWWWKLYAILIVFPAIFLFLLIFVRIMDILLTHTIGGGYPFLSQFIYNIIIFVISIILLKQGFSLIEKLYLRIDGGQDKLSLSKFASGTLKKRARLLKNIGGFKRIAGKVFKSEKLNEIGKENIGRSKRLENLAGRIENIPKDGAINTAIDYSIDEIEKQEERKKKKGKKEKKEKDNNTGSQSSTSSTTNWEVFTDGGGDQTIGRSDAGSGSGQTAEGSGGGRNAQTTGGSDSQTSGGGSGGGQTSEGNAQTSGGGGATQPRTGGSDTQASSGTGSGSGQTSGGGRNAQTTGGSDSQTSGGGSGGGNKLNINNGNVVTEEENLAKEAIAMAEKLLKDRSNKVSEDEKKDIEKKISELKSIKGSRDINEITSKTKSLAKAFLKVFRKEP